MKILAMATLFIALGFSASSLPRSTTERIDSEIEAAAMKLLDEYMTAWNRKDVTAWERTFHFPHYRAQ